MLIIYTIIQNIFNQLNYNPIKKINKFTFKKKYLYIFNLYFNLIYFLYIFLLY